jgi:hypothetical protein
MGSSTILDIVGSYVVGGLLFMMLLQLNITKTETSTSYNMNYILQANMVTLVTLLEEDFRKIGYCRNWRRLSDPSVVIRVADLHRMRYYTDFYDVGAIDSVTYWYGDSTELSSTQNPRDRYLYRQVNNLTPIKYNLGLTQFNLSYRNAMDLPTTDPAQVIFMEINVCLESSFPYHQEYMNDTTQYQVYWRQIRMATRNLNNR